jgi:prephenate dehydratase
MKNFETYSPERIIIENLQELTERADLLGEQEIAHLRELAIEIAQSDDLFDLLSSLPYYRIPSRAPSTDTLTNHAELLARSRKLLEARQCMLLAKALYEELHQRQILLSTLFPDAEEAPAHAKGRIVYQKSNYTDDAYLTFATLVPNARVSYAHSFHAACEEVFNGHCEYCILPIENAVEGDLVGFAKLISQYDLKIAASCDIAGIDASRKTRFALLRRNILPFLAADTQENDFFRFSIPAQSAPTVASVLSGASFFGITFLSANTLPLDKDGATACFHLTFDVRGGDLLPFLLYLATVAPEYTPIGIYSHILQKGR